MATIYGENDQFKVTKKNGDTILEGKMVDKKIDGALRVYSKSVLVSLVQYKNGKREGPFSLYNPKTGLLFKMGVYHEDKQEGETLIYDDKSALVAKETFKNGVLTGEKLSYYPTGQVLKEQIYDQGKEVQSKTFYMSGKLLEERYFDLKGVLVQMGRYLEDGTVIETFTTKMEK